MLHLLSQAVSLLSFVGIVLVIRAFLPLVFRVGDSLTRLLSAGIALFMVATALRAFWWDWFRLFLGDSWPSVRDTFGGITVNLIPNILTLIAVYLFFQVRFLVIPDEERRHWRWWTAWAHPANRCIFPWRRQ